MNLSSGCFGFVLDLSGFPFINNSWCGQLEISCVTLTVSTMVAWKFFFLLTKSHTYSLLLLRPVCVPLFHTSKMDKFQVVLSVNVTLFHQQKQGFSICDIPPIKKFIAIGKVSLFLLMGSPLSQFCHHYFSTASRSS